MLALRNLVLRLKSKSLPLGGFRAELARNALVLCCAVVEQFRSFAPEHASSTRELAGQCGNLCVDIGTDHFGVLARIRDAQLAHFTAKKLDLMARTTVPISGLVPVHRWTIGGPTPLGETLPTTTLGHRSAPALCVQRLRFGHTRRWIARRRIDQSHVELSRHTRPRALRIEPADHSTRIQRQIAPALATMAELRISEANRAITVPFALGVIVPHRVATLPVVSELAFDAAGRS